MSSRWFLFRTKQLHSHNEYDDSGDVVRTIIGAYKTWERAYRAKEENSSRWSSNFDLVIEEVEWED